MVLIADVKLAAKQRSLILEARINFNVFEVGFERQEAS